MHLRSALRPLSLVLIAGLPLLLAGCGDDDGGESSSASDASDASEDTGSYPTPEVATELPDGTFETPDGSVFADPPEFAVNADTCGADELAFPTPPNTVELAEDAGVAVDYVEWLTFHVHGHVSVFIDGEPREVPADLGIDNETHQIAALHTHDCTGQIHMEAEEEAEFDLGQLLALWDVDLEDQEEVAVFLNGDEVDDPATLPLAQCDEVAIVIGEAPATIPDDGRQFC